MSNPWEAPSHTNPLYGPQNHATPNPTAPSADPGMLGGNNSTHAWVDAPVSQDPRLAARYAGYRFVPVAILLAVCLGPLGVLYVGFLNGVGATLLFYFVGRALYPFFTAAASGAPSDAALAVFGLALAWAIGIPWAIIGAKIRNARRAKRLGLSDG